MASLCSNASSTAALLGIARLNVCKLTGGLNRMFLGSFSDVDWATTKTSPNFNSTTEVLTTIVFLATKLAVELVPDGGTTTAGGEMQANGLYANSYTLMHEGQACARDLAIRTYKDRCDLWALLEGNCFKRLAGVVWNGTDFVQDTKPIKLTGHTWTFGTESDAPNDTLIFTNLSTRKPICADPMTTITTS